MTDQKLAEEIVHHIYENDAFNRWLNIQIQEIAPGAVSLSMEVRDDMLNGIGICHGGIVFSLCDSALAYAANSHGRIAVALSNSISYPQKIDSGDTITAVAEELSLTNATATYDVTATNQDGDTVGLFRGTVYRTNKEFFNDQ